MKISPARVVAFQVLLALEKDTESHSGVLLAGLTAGLSREDAGLCTALVYETLRNRILLDYQLGPMLKKHPGTGVMTILRLAAAQKFLFSRIPAHAIVNESVELAKSALKASGREIGFVNAITNKLVTHSELAFAKTGSWQSRASVRWSQPTWILGMLAGKFGRIEAERIAAACTEEAHKTLRVNSLIVSRDSFLEELQARGVDAGPTLLSPDGVIPGGRADLGALLRSAVHESGKFYVQDEGSQLVAHISSPQPGERILDLCAAPGGKTTHLAELARGKASITATDISLKRLQRVHDNIARLKTPGVEIRAFEDVGNQGELYDLVLVDSPCSGLGTLRRNPEIRYRSSYDNVERLAAAQRNLLSGASRFVRPGGRLVYSTCTFTDQENSGVAEAFLHEHESFKISKETSASFAGALLRDDGSFRTWPEHLEMDAFEVRIFRKQL